jgi:DNA-binding transcriptional ArsR family regulator
MTNGVDEVLAALADPTRQRVLESVAARGEATATMVAAELPVSRQAIAKHLAILERAGLVASRKQGREMRYSVCPERLDATARWMGNLAAEWDARLARLKRLAESGTRGGDDR